MDCWPVFIRLLETFPTDLPEGRMLELLREANSFLIRNRLVSCFAIIEEDHYDDWKEEAYKANVLRPRVDEADRPRLQGEDGICLIAGLWQHRCSYGLLVADKRIHAYKIQKEYLDILWLNSVFFDNGVNCYVVESYKDQTKAIHFVAGGKSVAIIRI